jgi:hypothetical protein
MMRRVLFAFLLAVLAGCSRPLPLPDTIVQSGTAEELAEFRVNLGAAFPADQLQAFDTALVELKLDAMNRSELKSAEDRDEFVRTAINGLTVRAIEVRGWQARRSRLLSELAQISELLANERRAAARTADAGTPSSILTHLQNEEEISARLQRDITAAEKQLADWGVKQR